MTLLIALLLAQVQAYPCMDDAKKLCPDVKAGEGRIAACLKEHKDQLSVACNANLAQFKEQAPACQAESEKLCPGMKPGKERRECIKSHKDQLSPECLQFFMKVSAAHDVVNYCRADLKKFCSDVKPSDASMEECLKAHYSDLASGCAARMKP
jgi:hypothetical protein